MIIQISTANSRLSKTWRGEQLTWEAFCERLREPRRGTETLADYMKLTKAQQDDLKDVGGFVGGTFTAQDRKLIHLKERSLITLDLDTIQKLGTEDVLRKIESLHLTAVVYSTRKHSARGPRLRVLLPFAEPVSPDQYEPCARRVAQWIGIDSCDPTTFEGNRLMFWPSVSADSEYVYRVFDGPAVTAEELLATYDNWTDQRQWPILSTEKLRTKKMLAKQQDPLEKDNLIGTFCRTYSIPEAMDAFLPGLYEPGSDEDRYTYIGGTTSNGAILYQDGRFLFSHHATDPCSGQLVNAWDMVRLHKFEELDDAAAAGTPVNRLPSYKAMVELAKADSKVQKQQASERTQKLQEVFGSDLPAEVNAELQEELQYTENGTLRKTIRNVVLLMQHDESLKGLPALDAFSGRIVAIGPLPWDTQDTIDEWHRTVKDGPAGKAKRDWTDTDNANLISYIEAKYGIGGTERITNALSIVAAQNKFNDVADYLNRIRWDGVKRLDTCLVDYLGAANTEYNRTVIRKMLLAACARAVHGTIKFDNMLILAGPQGTFKSSFLRILGGAWFSDSLCTFEGKEAAELIQGVWIIEIPELQAFGRSETNLIKQFLSKVDDDYRPAYGRMKVRHPRRCVFFGTTNDTGFLRDQTGNRRFWPVDVRTQQPTKNVFEDLPGEVDQIWAEAYTYYRLGEPLILSEEMEKEAMKAQEEHRDVSDWESMIEAFLERPIPPRWYEKTREEMRQLMNMPPPVDGERRVRVCSAEIWELCLGGTIRNLNNGISRKINQILRNLPGWYETRGLSYGPYGYPRGFERL